MGRLSGMRVPKFILDMGVATGHSSHERPLVVSRIFRTFNLAERHPDLGHAVMAPLICWSFSNSMFRYLLVDHANRNKCSDIWEPAKAIWCWCWLRPRRPLHPSGTAQAVASALVDISQTILQHAVERITAAGLASKVATRREDL